MRCLKCLWCECGNEMSEVNAVRVKEERAWIAMGRKIIECGGSDGRKVGCRNVMSVV